MLRYPKVALQRCHLRSLSDTKLYHEVKNCIQKLLTKCKSFAKVC